MNNNNPITTEAVAAAALRKRQIVEAAVLLMFLFLMVLLKLSDIAIGLLFPPVSPPSLFSFSSSSPYKRVINLREIQPDKNIVLIPPDTLLQRTDRLEKKGYHLRTDHDGFILGPGEIGSTPSTPDAVDIIFFGGSTTECLYVDEDKRFPYLVADGLLNAENKRLHVLNAGVSGNSSMNSVLNLLGKGLPYKPRYVVLMNAVNDVAMLSKTLSYWKGQEGRKVIQQITLAAAPAPVRETAKALKNLLFPNAWRIIQQRLQTMATQEADEWSSFRDKKYSFDEIERVLEVDYRASLKTFVGVSRAWGIEPILMTQFNRISSADWPVRQAYEAEPEPVSYDEFVLLYSRANKIVREVAGEEHIKLIDLDDKVEHSSKYIYDAVHLNTNGSIFVAELIKTELLRNFPGSFRRRSEPLNP